MNLWITSYILLYAKNIPLYLRSLSNSGNLPRTLNTIFWIEYLKSFVGDGKGKHIKADPGFTVDAVQSRDRAIKRIKLISAREAVNCNFVRVFIKVLKTTSWKDFCYRCLGHISRTLRARISVTFAIDFWTQERPNMGLNRDCESFTAIGCY